MAFIELYYFYDEIQEKGPANRIKTIADELELFEEISVCELHTFYSFPKFSKRANVWPFVGFPVCHWQPPLEYSI